MVPSVAPTLGKAYANRKSAENRPAGDFYEDGLFHVGAMATGWYLWDMTYTGDPTIHVVDVQKYAKLGGYKD